MIWTYVGLGVSLGFSAGLAPGPLTALIVQRSLRDGFRSGLRIALAPLLTDLPIVLLSLWLAGRAPEGLLRILSLAGGIFLLWIGLDAWRNPRGGPEIPPAGGVRRDWLHGMLVNALNPHPYLFWITVGAPAFVNAGRNDPLAAGLFLLAFYLLLIGSKILLAAVAARAPGCWRNRRAAASRGAALLLFAAGLYLIAWALRIAAM